MEREPGGEEGDLEQHLNQEHPPQEPELDQLLQPPSKRLCLEYLGGCNLSGENSLDSTISMDNSSEVVTKIAGLYAERLMSDVILVVGESLKLIKKYQRC